MITLEQAIACLRTPQEVQIFLRVVSSPRETKWLQRRWRTVQMQIAGASQRRIAAQLRTSTTTAGRGSRSAKKHDQFVRQLLDRISQPKRDVEEEAATHRHA